ncbi:hypothetical protein SAY87_022109 [Trapa incisa]|uniref:Fe2OG dioxygenase domain-containing protein n=1 Tax=Trapa incisa TaxID=236973 RepID=A0AAN7JTD6_9MYRT|nr:hypothetical protein SAY87_022109 [Trapa incisa]
MISAEESYGGSWEPPLAQTISSFLKESSSPEGSRNIDGMKSYAGAKELQDFRRFTGLPLIDISRLLLGEDRPQRRECEREIAVAARVWGFFQIVNHGIPAGVMEKIKEEQKKVFRQPFEVKMAGGGKLHSLGANNYRWGNPMATSPRQVSWSEAFHIPITDISRIEDETLRSAIETFANVATDLTEKIAGILARDLGAGGVYFRENCTARSCYLRMNRYPPCPFSPEILGLVPHTDSDFLTIVFQDGVGGLQLMRDDGSWAGVFPNPDALIINIGDLLQAWSNGVYKSVRHRVVASSEEERLSMAFFYCPKSDTVIQSCINPSVYRNFSFQEYRLQVQKDVQATGDKVGLSRFLVQAMETVNTAATQ